MGGLVGVRWRRQKAPSGKSTPPEAKETPSWLGIAFRALSSDPSTYMLRLFFVFNAAKSMGTAYNFLKLITLVVLLLNSTLALLEREIKIIDCYY